MKQIVIKTPEEIAKMRHSGALLAKVFAMLDEVIVEGISTMEINDRAEAFIVEELKSRPASKGQYDFPYVLNTSIDDVVCHGVPSASKILRSGMIINVDITLENGGYIADSSKMYCVGQVTPLAKRLVNNVYESMWQGIRAVKPGATWAISAMPSSGTPSRPATASCGSIAATASAAICMKSRRYCTTVNPAAVWCCRKAWCSPSSR